MQELPHHYSVSASASATDAVALSSTGLSTIESGPPAEYGGSGTLWSPETLLTAAVADCFVLSFRAIARASRLDWKSISCDVSGTLDRVEKTTRFTRFDLHVVLVPAPGTDEAKARRLLEKSEESCLITNSLTSSVHLDAKVLFETE